MAGSPLGSGSERVFLYRKKSIGKNRFLKQTACIYAPNQHRLTMELPGHAVNLSAEQVAELNKQLSNFRHDVNNNLALIIAGLEVLQQKPHLAERMMATVREQPPKIVASLSKFANEFDKILGIKR